MMPRLMPVAMTMTEEVCSKSCDWYRPSLGGLIVLFLLLEYGGFGSVSGKIETDIKINHEGEVNR